MTTYAKVVKVKRDAKVNGAEVVTMKPGSFRQLDQTLGTDPAVVKTARPIHLPE